MSREHITHTTDDSTGRRPRRRKAMTAAMMALVLGSIPLAAAPAQAATAKYVNPCAVTAERPYHNGGFTHSGKKTVVYPIRIDCWRHGARVQLQQTLKEGDTWPNSDDTQRGWRWTSPSTVYSEPGSQRVKTVYRLADMDDVGNSEVYHKVGFRVSDHHGNYSKWYYVTSPERSIHP